MKKILVPCDFSKPAINAYRFALDIAAKSKGSILLFHVIELPVMSNSVIMPVLNFEEQLFKELEEAAKKRFDDLLKKYDNQGVRVDTEIVFGAVSLMATNAISDKKIDLVIMGSHGASGLREMFVGSNAEKIVRRSSAPVLVIKNYFKGPVKDIVFPNTLDEEGQEELVQKVKSLQSFFKATLHLVWVNTPLNFTPDTITHQKFKEFAKRHQLKNFSVSIFNYPNEENGILEFARLMRADLIAMGTHSRKGLSHLFNGSTAEDVVNHGNKMVWTYSLNPVLTEA